MTQLAHADKRNPLPPCNTLTRSINLINDDIEVNRESLFQPFLDYAQCRNIVFANGGHGSGLNTFIHQFQKFLEDDHAHKTSSADFDSTIWENIYKVRQNSYEANKDLITDTDQDQLGLKCLLTTLAFSAYHVLRGLFKEPIDKIVPCQCNEQPIRFGEYYFSNSDVMFQADPIPIVKYFFETIERLVDATKSEGVIVFMPWRSLSSCFGSQEKNLQNGAYSFLRALSNVASCPSEKVNLLGEPKASNLKTNIYDKVCLIVVAKELPYDAFQKALVANNYWVMPPLSKDDTREYIKKACPDYEFDDAIKNIHNATGGSPWFTRLVISLLTEIEIDQQQKLEKVKSCVSKANQILATDGIGTEGDLGKFVHEHIVRVQTALGDGEATDGEILAAWQGPRLSKPDTLIYRYC